jgi:hypothetical protein
LFSLGSLLPLELLYVDSFLENLLVCFGSSLPLELLSVALSADGLLSELLFPSLVETSGGELSESRSWLEDIGSL